MDSTSDLNAAPSALRCSPSISPSDPTVWREKLAERITSAMLKASLVTSQSGATGPDGLSVAREVGECAIRSPIIYMVQSMGFDAPSDADIEWIIEQVRASIQELYDNGETI